VKRIAIAERPNWRKFAEEVGFHFHTLGGEPYWDETAYYQFNLAQIEQHIEAPTEEIHQMVMDMLDDIVSSEENLTQLCIPPNYWEYLAQSWKYREPHLYGRMDFSYHGTGPAKLLELNYDTPTSLFETGFFQWVWLEDQIKSGLLPAHADQFNSLQDKLEQAFASLRLPKPFYFSSVRDSEEDKGTVHYLMDIATQAGVDARYIAIEDIGELNGQFIDENNENIRGLFKLYPWEFMLQEEFGEFVMCSNTQIIEPGWKMLLSNKGILPLLWQRYANHPNLLPAFFETSASPALTPGWVRKPIFSREGANVSLITTTGEKFSVPGPYDDGAYIRQEYKALPNFYDEARKKSVYPLIGSWIVGDSAAGIGVREDDGLITQNTSRFIPQVILD
jgi:glutathionylspermidine synthase